MVKKLMNIFENKSMPDLSSIKDDYFTPVPEDYQDDIDLEYDVDDEELDGISPAHSLDNNEYHTGVKEGDTLLMVRGLNKYYSQGGNKLEILKNVDLRLHAGEITALIGPSGSGKSTLLHILGLLDAPSSGQIFIGGNDISSANDKMRTKLRSGHIGFVYQFHHLLPEFSAVENVALPLIIAGVKTKYASDKAADLLEQLGLGHRLKHRPATMSGGEQQRVAIARALINDPYLLFADEPTGNLDPETSEEVFELLLTQVRTRGIGALIATHNMDLANEMDRILEVKSGRVLPY